jgi:hypothetical protein
LTNWNNAPSALLDFALFRARENPGDALGYRAIDQAQPLAGYRPGKRGCRPSGERFRSRAQECCAT